jgi:hypothetical protein
MIGRKPPSSATKISFLKKFQAQEKYSLIHAFAMINRTKKCPSGMSQWVFRTYWITQTLMLNLKKSGKN